MVDEIQLTPSLVYDASSGTVLGRPTIPLADESLPDDCLATHGLVFMLGGLSTRWKQTVAFHFTGNSFSTKKVKEEIVNILQTVENIGVTVDVVITDMGGGNQGLWKEFGITVSKYGRYRVSCPHPCNASRLLFFMADVPHLLKNLRNHLTRGQVIYLPDNIVKDNMLPTSEVKIDYAKRLVELDSSSELKIAPHLKPASVDPGHFEKMKVGLAFSLLNNDTAAALRLLVERKDMSRDALATAWFFETIFKWFRLMTSRTTKLAVSTLDANKHDEAVAFLNSIVQLFEGLSIGGSGKKTWKPVQTGVILSTTSALQLQELYLNEREFKFVLLSRLSQDSLENLFSTLRSKNPVPRPTEFRCAIRHATMAQFLRPSKDGSYADDEGFLLAGLPAKDAPKLGDCNIATPDDVLDLGLLEHESLQYLAGYVVHKVKQNLKCTVCTAAMTGDSEANRLIQLKSYVKDTMPLTVPSAAITQVVQHAEAYFRNNQSKLIMNQVTLQDLQKAIFESISFSNCFPECHEILTNVLKLYLKTRLCIILRKENEEWKERTKNFVKCGSRSVGMHTATTNLK